jgi:hypothetical protein
MLRQVVPQVAPPEFASEVVLKDRPSEDDGRDTDRSTEIREAPPLFSTSFGSVHVDDVAVLPITGPLADLLPAPLPVRLDQRRDELDQTAQLGELDRQPFERICVDADFRIHAHVVPPPGTRLSRSCP